MDDIAGAQDFVTKLTRWRTSHGNAFLVSRSPERVPEVSELRRILLSLGIKDLKYFDEGLDCIQYAQAPRAAIVLGWTGFVDLLQSKIGRDGYVSLNSILKIEFHAIYRRVGHINTHEALTDNFDDALLVEAGRKLKFYDKHVWTQLNAMRDERNNCAHVQEYAVNVRISLGFYAHLIEFLPYVI